MLVTCPQGVVPTISNFIKVSTPLIGAGIVFVSVSCVGAVYRGKQDAWNYSIAGAAAGGSLGAYGKY